MNAAKPLADEIMALLKARGAKGIVMIAEGDKIWTNWVGMGAGQAVDLLKDARESIKRTLIAEEAK